MKWTNQLSELLQIKYPIIQAPMFGVTTPEMVAAVSNMGALGSLPLGQLPLEKCNEIIQQTKKLTSKPFAVNLFLNSVPPVDEELITRYAAAKKFIEDLAQRNGFFIEVPDFSTIPENEYRNQIDLVISNECSVLSFTFGNLDDESIAKLKSHNITLIGTCTSVHEAKILATSGIDILCVQGIEAGGHRASFNTEDIPGIGGISLLAQVVDSLNLPIIYAGGIFNSRTLIATHRLGASGVQIGSLLLGSKESALKDFEKKRIRSVEENEIVLTKSLTGRYARGVKNKLIEALEESGHILPYPYQIKLTNELRTEARANGNEDFVNLWMGQSIHEFSDESAATIISNLIKQTEEDFNP